MADEVDRLSDLVRDAQKLIESAEVAQEAFRVGDVAAASRAVGGMTALLAEIQRQVDALDATLRQSS